MSLPSVPNPLNNGTTSDATEVSQNFTALINSLTDGTKDITVAAISASTITASGAVTLNGAVTLGNGSGDVITVTGTPSFGTEIELAGSNLSSASAPDADTLYPNCLPKAWAWCDGSAGAGVTVADGFNLSVAYSSTGVFIFTFRTDMANANYMVACEIYANSSDVRTTHLSGTKSTSSFTVRTFNAAGNAADLDFGVVVFGSQ